MSVLSGLEPKKVFYFFEEICKIPHGSYHTKEISDYCVDFAKKRGLWVYQDEADNVIIKKPGTKGYENAETIILQGIWTWFVRRRPTLPAIFKKTGWNWRSGTAM